MELLIVRHGPAWDKEAWKATRKDDRLRPLSPEGRQKMRKNAKGLVTLVSELDEIIASPLTRARQTASISDPSGAGCRASNFPPCRPHSAKEHQAVDPIRWCCLRWPRCA